MTTFQAMQPHDYMVFLMTCMYKHKGWHKTCNDSTLKSVLQAARSTSGAEVHSKSSCKRKEEKKKEKSSARNVQHTCTCFSQGCLLVRRESGCNVEMLLIRCKRFVMPTAATHEQER